MAENKAMFAYYNTKNVEQFLFYQIPKALFTDPVFSGLSCEAKVLYSLMLDRQKLSIQNGWYDEKGRVFIYFQIVEVVKLLGCGTGKAVSLVQELDSERGIGLIEKKRRGCGPNAIYVKDFTSRQSSGSENSADKIPGNKATFPYYNAEKVERFHFYQLPKALFTDPIFSGLSCKAKMLYSLMLDRQGLSIKNEWYDEQGRVFICFQISEIMGLLGCGNDKAVALAQELDSERGIGLIEKKRRGLGLPNVIYVKDFSSCLNNDPGELTSEDLKDSRTAAPQTNEATAVTDSMPCGDESSEKRCEICTEIPAGQEHPCVAKRRVLLKDDDRNEQTPSGESPENSRIWESEITEIGLPERNNTEFNNNYPSPERIPLYQNSTGTSSISPPQEKSVYHSEVSNNRDKYKKNKKYYNTNYIPISQKGTGERSVPPGKDITGCQDIQGEDIDCVIFGHTDRNLEDTS